MQKINTEELLRLIDEGVQQQDIAARMGVTPAAVCKKLKRLRPVTRPAILDKLTAKEQKFVAAIVAGDNQQQAALKAFECTSLDSAKTIGCRLAKDPEIAEAISAVMESEGLSKRYLVKRLKNHIDSPDPNVSIRGVDMGLKLHDAFPASKNLNINADLDLSPVDLSKYQ